MSPNDVQIRREVVFSKMTEILDEFLNEGVSPPEAMLVAELLLWQLTDNLLKLSPPEHVEKLRQTAIRAIDRLKSRAMAWPTKLEDKQ